MERQEGKAFASNASHTDPDDFNKPFHGWSKEVSPRCGLPWVEQDYSGHDLSSPFQMKPSLTICMVADQKDKSPDLKGSSFEKATEQVFPGSHSGVEPNVNISRHDLPPDKTDYCEDKVLPSLDSPRKTKNVNVKRNPSKRPQPKASDKGQEITSERKKLKSLGWKLRCKMLNVRKTCRKCLNKSASYSLNIMHEQLEHPHVCQICTDHLFSFVDANSLKRHEDQIHSAVPLETASQKTSYSKALESEHVTKNISEDVAIVAVMPKILKKSYRCERGVKEGSIKIVSVNNGNEIGSDVTKQSIQKYVSNCKQTVKEEKIITELKPDKQLDINKNEAFKNDVAAVLKEMKSLPIDRNLKLIPQNLIEPGTSVASTPIVHKNGASWKGLKDRLKSPEFHNSYYIQANQPQQLQHKKTVTLPERAAIDAGPIDNMDNLWNTNLFDPPPATLATESTRETSPCVKLEASSTAANLKDASVGIPGVKLSNPMSGDMKDRMRGKGRVKTRGGVWPRMQMGRGVIGMEGQRPRIEMGRGVIGLQDQRPRMQVGPGVIGMQGQRPRMQMGIEATGMKGQRPRMQMEREAIGMQDQRPQMQVGPGVIGMQGQRPQIEMGRGLIGLQDQRPQMQVGPGVIGMQGQRPHIEMGRGVIGLQDQRPRMQVGHGVIGMQGRRPRIQMGHEAVGLQDQRPRMQVGPGVIGMQGKRPRMQMGREAIGMQGQRPPGIYGAPHRPSCAGRENLKSPGVSGASPMESFIPGAPYRPQLPKDRICKPASKISTGPVVPVDPNNLPPAPKPIIIKVETIDISDEDSPPTSTDDMLDRLKTSMPGISVTRNITPTKLKGLEVPPGISVSPAPTISRSQRKGVSREDVDGGSYSSTAAHQDPNEMPYEHA